MVDVFTFGLNHHSAPVSVRERVSMSGDLVRPALDALRSAFGSRLKEATILSTCNRTELYLAANPEIVEHVPTWLADFNTLDSSLITPHLYQYNQDQAVRHAFRVASGLDSMVLGEAQILGQMKTAVRAANEAGALGTMLNQLFQKTFSVAKEVRTQTAIGAQSVSMAAAAVRLAERVFGDIADTKVLFVGAGEMIELCATHFSAHNPKSIMIANRTLERGASLAARFDAQNMRLVDLPEHLHEYDIVVSCTASALPILGLGMIQKALRQRRFNPMVMVDLAVPRDIEPEVGSLSEVYLYTVDDLGRVVQMGNDARQAAVVQAEAIIDSRVQSFMHWMQNRNVVPIIQGLHSGSHKMAELELEKARKLLAKGVSPEDALERLAKALIQKYMHAPVQVLNRSQDEERAVMVDILPKLFPYQETEIAALIEQNEH
ncbi:glutamyl-tRNA reductase [Pelistega indica]|uniref:Glutamyl-tRNA reductase n=1 Tax=Pelistega indica TaxID=1414851 RepID=V8FSJ6_9BURK|nr:MULTISPECIES: glutamyl-tRNA reductase [Pelistega]ETD67274.1 glutamyl-tRNA reductase [Pelistega indica]